MRERKEKQGGNWGVKMNGKLQQGCENEFSKRNIYNIIDYLMERIHETTPNIYIYIYIYNREIVDDSNHFLIFRIISSTNLK